MSYTSFLSLLLSSDFVELIFFIKHERRSLGNFGVTWKVFSSNPILYLGKEYENKRVNLLLFNVLQLLKVYWSILVLHVF